MARRQVHAHLLKLKAEGKVAGLERESRLVPGRLIAVRRYDLRAR